VLDSSKLQYFRHMKILLSVAVLIGAFVTYLVNNHIRTPGAALTSHNHTDRPVGSYWVNDHWGGNGGVTCCWSISGDSAKVVWILSLSKTQEEQGMKIERHEAQVPLPSRNPGEDTLHVYFFPNNQIQLVWASTTLDPRYRTTGAVR
jgi:hypothetical protein